MSEKIMDLITYGMCVTVDREPVASDLMLRLRKSAAKYAFCDHVSLEDEAADEIGRKDAAIAELVKEIGFIIRDMEDGKILVTPCYDVHPAEYLRAVIAKYNTKAAA